MENLGSLLKERREKLNKSLEELHEQTRITTEHLEFLEDNNFDFLPETYVKSYLKSYARALELDEDEILNSYLEIQETNKQEQKEASSALGLEEQTSVLNSQIVEWALGIGAIVLIMGIILVYLQYRSYIHAKPAEQFVILPKIKMLPADKIIFPKDTELSKSEFEIQIKTKYNVWVYITDADNSVTKYYLSPENNLTFTTEDQFIISVGSSRNIRFSLDGMEIGKSGASGDNIRLTFTKSDLKNKENKNPPY